MFEPLVSRRASKNKTSEKSLAFPGTRDIARKNNWPVTHTHEEERHDKSAQSGEQAQQSRSKLFCRPIFGGKQKR